MAKKIGSKNNPHNAEKVRGVATSMQILYGFAPKSPQATPISKSLVSAFGDVDSARSLRLDSAHFGELQT